MASLALRQASALLWLRVTLARRRLFGERAYGRAALSIAGLLIGAAGSLGLGALVLEKSHELARDKADLESRGGPMAVFAIWLAMLLVARLWFSVRALGGTSLFLDPRRFLPYAVPARVVSTINFAAAVLEPTWLFFYAPLAAIAVGIAGLPGAPPFWALLAAEAVTVLSVAGVLHLFGALGAVLEGRPALQRALLIVLGFGGFAAFQLAAARPGRLGLASLFAERRWKLIALTPPGWAAVLARALGDHSALHAFTPLLLLLTIAAAAALAAHKLSLREAQRPLPVEHRPSSRAAAHGWQLPFGSSALSALVEKETKTILRAGWLQLVVVPAGFLLLRTAFIGAGPGTFGAQPLLLAAAYAHLGVLEVAINAFGRDLGATRGWFLWPVDRRTIFAAKNAVAYCFSLVLFALLAAVVAFSGRVSPQAVLVGLLAHAATFPILAAFGNLASVLWPTPLRALLRRVRGAGPIGSRLAAVLLLGVAAWAPYALASLASRPVVFAYAGALVVAAIAYGGLLAFSAALMESRKEQLVAALAKDD